MLIVDHENSLRALVKKRLDGLPKGEAQNPEIPAGYPLVYELDGEARPAAYCLGDPHTRRAGLRAVYLSPAPTPGYITHPRHLPTQVRRRAPGQRAKAWTADPPPSPGTPESL
jgi:hypothetical protein